MSAGVVVFGTAFIFLAAATVALVLSRASREAEIRKEIAADIRAHAEEPARFRPDGEYVKAMRRAALIAEGVKVEAPKGFGTLDGSGRVRMAGDWRRSS